ncbi:MAG: shikimate kinase, partial [Sphaerochaetaceae bacterium]|nr:shikimate kinase [Sphaerochaetaceae bacterium]
TGGGACDNARLVDLMKQSGSVIYLYRKEQWLFDKIAASGIPHFLDQDNPRRSFHLLYLERDAIYRSIADYMLQLIDSDSVEHNVQILVQLLSSIL